MKLISSCLKFWRGIVYYQGLVFNYTLITLIGIVIRVGGGEVNNSSLTPQELDMITCHIVPSSLELWETKI